MSWILILAMIVSAASGCQFGKKHRKADSTLATISINELATEGYQRYEFEIVTLEGTSFSLPRKSFERGHGKIGQTVPRGKYKIMLDFFQETAKVYSADYCESTVRNNEVNLKSGMNELNIVICNINKMPIDAELVITPVLRTKPTIPDQTTGTVIEQNGWLQLAGTQLVNQKGAPVQLKGISSHGLQWNEGRYANYEAMKWLRDNWKISVFRLAMYTAEGGYVQNASVKSKVVTAVDAAISLGIYVIIDWHILTDGDPNTNKAQAKLFFAEMSQLYKDAPNVLYEICNEPNGDNVTWKDKIKPYAEEVIPIIRENSPRALVIVGTGKWSQDVHDVVDAPLSFTNVMYAVHFYAKTHRQWLRDRIEAVIAKGLPVFVSEWGTSAADGSAGNDFEESTVWVNFMNSKKISWVNWSMADKDESSAILKPGANEKGSWTDSDLTSSGLYIKGLFP